jgi:micrococcal nuclease
MTESAYKRFYHAFLIILLPLLLLIPAKSSAGQFKVTRVYDGDTVKAEGHDIEIKVRLVGIDAPETSKKKHEPGQPFSQLATKHLAGLVLNKMVDVKGYGMDRYNRVLGEIFINGKNVNLEMVRVGLAEVYDGRPPRGFDTGPYLEAEREATQEKRGMWAQGEEYVSPSEWRRMQREGG